MTDSEWKEFYTYLFAAFPSIRSWLAKSCQKLPDGTADIKSTVDTWRRTLASCTLVECRKIVDDWVECRNNRKPPSGYELDHVALIIRQSVFFDRDIKARHERTIEQIKKHQQAKARNYERHSNFIEIWNEAREHIEAMRDGRITQDEFDRIKNELASRVT